MISESLVTAESPAGCFFNGLRHRWQILDSGNINLVYFMVFQVRSTWLFYGRKKKWPHLRKKGSEPENCEKMRDRKSEDFRILSYHCYFFLSSDFGLKFMDFFRAYLSVVSGILRCLSFV